MTNANILITVREQEVLQLLAKGLTYKEMALQLGVTSETVKKHLKNIYRKLEARNKIAALNKVNAV